MSKPIISATTARFGDYDLIEKVGEGGMAEVWLARREGFGGVTKSCALKLPLERHAGDERFRRMFLSEARLALKLNHGNIVTVFDAGEVDGRLYMALEWIDGVDLRSFAQRIHDIPMRFSFPVVCHVVGEVLQALRYAHTFAIGGKGLGIIHRDVSPQNVLVSSSGEVKLSDFGIARVMGEDTSQVHIKGKLRYMAPEQFRGKPVQGSDLYAVGAIMHELIEGHRFRSGLESQEDWIRVLMTDSMPALTRRGVPEGIAALHDGLLQPDPEKRFKTADDALAQLHLCPEWRNSTTELRKLYARYFNENRRTGLTRGDGDLLALSDEQIAAARRSRQASTPGPMPGGTQQQPASGAISPGLVSADPEPPPPLAPASAGPAAPPSVAPAAAAGSPQQPEPDAPVFFRKGARRGRPPSSPEPLSGQTTSPHAPGDHEDRPTTPRPAAAADGGSPRDPDAPTAFRRPRSRPATGAVPTSPPTQFLPDSSPQAAPGGTPPPTQFLPPSGGGLGGGHEGFPDSGLPPQARHESGPRTQFLPDSGFPGAQHETGAPTQFLPDHGSATDAGDPPRTAILNVDDPSSPLAIGTLAGPGQQTDASITGLVHPHPDDGKLTNVDRDAPTTTSTSLPVERPDRTRLILIIVAMVLAAASGAVAVAKFVLGGDDEAPAAESGADAQSGVVVRVHLNSLEHAWLRIGDREFFVDGTINEKLAPGEHPLAWKTEKSAEWTDHAPLTLVEGKEHMITIAADGLTLTSYDP